jgi:hypothetical protein
VRFHRGVWETDAWRSLGPEARCLVLAVWQRFNGSNNGRIPLSWREALQEINVGWRRLQRAYDEAQDRGFIVPKQRGSFDWKSGGAHNLATEWEVTTEPLDGREARELFKDWKPPQPTKKKCAVPDVGTASSRRGNYRADKTTSNAPRSSRRGSYSGRNRQLVAPDAGALSVCHVQEEDVEDTDVLDWGSVGRVLVRVGPLGPGTNPVDRSEWWGAA